MPQILDLPVELDFPVEDVCCEACDRTATHRVIWHTCNRELACREHVEAFLDDINSHAGIECLKCYRMFFPAAEFMRVEPL